MAGFEAELHQRLTGLAADLAEIPQIKRGKVWCHECGRVESAGVECFRAGWPKCCGYTMSIDSPEELERLGGGRG